MSLSRRMSTASRDWPKLPTISCQFPIVSIRLHLEVLPPEFGWSLSINVPGSFRNPHSVITTEQWLTWAITNLYKNTHRPWIQNSRGKDIIKRKGWVSSLYCVVLHFSRFSSWGIGHAHVLATIPSCFWNTVTQLKFHRRSFPTLFAVRFLYYNATLLRFLNNIYFRKLRVDSCQSRHSRRAREDFRFLTVFLAPIASDALSAALNFLHLEKPNGCGRNGRPVVFLYR